MREIKFRAWDVRNEVMWLRKPKQLTSEFFQLIEQDTAGGEQFILMQYTGLKDKNGKECYEGDIVKTRARDEARQVVWNTQRACYYLHPLGEAKQNEVDVDEFNTATSMAPHWFTKDFYEKYEEDCAVEVIGNIYENKELLK